MMIMLNNLKILLAVIRGKLAWNGLRKSLNITQERYVIICLHKEGKIIKDYLDNLPRIIEQKRMERPIILTDDFEIVNEYGDRSDCLVLFLDTQKIDDVVKYYLLREFKERIVIVSLNAPFGSYGLIEAEKVRAEDMVTNYIW